MQQKAELISKVVHSISNGLNIVQCSEKLLIIRLDMQPHLCEVYIVKITE